MPEIQVQVFDEFHDRVDPAWLAQVAETALSVSGAADGASTGIVIADDQTVAELNAEHRGLDSTTDVLSFSNVHSGAYYGSGQRERDDLDFVLPPGHQPGIGEVVISFQQAQRQADVAGHTLRSELASLVAHGIFHLLGYDHELESDAGVMRLREQAAWESLQCAGLVE